MPRTDRQLLHEICIAAGDRLLQRFRTEVDLREKQDAGWVTEADLDSESCILDALRTHDASARIVSEERGVVGTDSGRSWYVDPLDGTTNFARGISLFVVSIGGTKGGDLSVGAIYQPTTGEFFFAEQGGGAFLGDQRLHVGITDSLRRGVIGTGDLYDRGPRFAEAMGQQRAVYEKAMTVRSLGSVALSLAYVAAGRLDAFFFDQYNTWDVAAGVLLVREAGGSVVDYQGECLHLREGGSIVAGSDRMVTALGAELGPAS